MNEAVRDENFSLDEDVSDVVAKSPSEFWRFKQINVLSIRYFQIVGFDSYFGEWVIFREVS